VNRSGRLQSRRGRRRRLCGLVEQQPGDALDLLAQLADVLLLPVALRLGVV
jgi:hypothetical protein